MVKKFFLMVAVVVGSVFLMRVSAHSEALTEGVTYTIEVDAISSAGAEVDLGLSTTAVADADGKISFSFSGLPTRTSYNFLLVTIKSASSNTVRQSIVPTAASGGTTNLGVSPMTYAQTQALLSAMSTAGSDDPVMVLFGSIIIRSGSSNFTGDNVTHLANIGMRSIKGPNGDDTVGGFNYYLLTKITTAQMATFKSAIVSRLGSYTSGLKDGVDAATAALAKDERGEAAALLSNILIEAANEADFELSYINAAMKAASDQQEEYLMSDDSSGMDEAAVSAMDSVMFSNYMKLNAENVRKKYETALTTLGASTPQVDKLNTAVTTLSNALVAAFQTFEALFQNEEDAVNSSDIDDAHGVIDTAMDNAFNSFMGNIAASDDEINIMIDAMVSGFGAPEDELNTMKDNDMFKFRDMSGTAKNWPITMVVPVTWVANNHPDDLTYTRDTLLLPAAMEWLSSRTDFGDEGMPTSLASLFGLREDIEIIQARKWTGLAAASADITQAGYDKLETAGGDDWDQLNDYVTGDTVTKIAVEDAIAEDSGVYLSDFMVIEDLSPYLTGEECQGIEGLFITRLGNRKDAISATGITDAQKKALVDTAMMPDFH